MSEAVEDPAGPAEDWRRAVGALRDAAKWIIAAFAAVGAAVLGVLPLAGVAEIDSAWAVILAVSGALLALAGVAYGVWATSEVLTPRASTLGTVAAMPSVVNTIEQDPSTYLGGVATTLGEFREDLSGWQRTTRELKEVSGPDEEAERRRVEALEIARGNVEGRAVTARRIVAFGHFEAVSATFRSARKAIFAGFAGVAVGIGLFLAATVVGKAEDSSTTGADDAGRPASVRLTLSERGKTELGDDLGESCVQQATVPAYLMDGDWVVVASPSECRPFAFRWDSSLGTVSL